MSRVDRATTRSRRATCVAAPLGSLLAILLSVLPCEKAGAQSESSESERVAARRAVSPEPAAPRPIFSRPENGNLQDRETTPPGDRGPSALFGIPGRNAYPQAGPIDPKVYRVGPGDVLLLQFWGRLSNSLPLEVTPEGTLLVPNAGTFEVAGRTLADVSEEVIRLLRKRLVGVNVDLRLARPRLFRVYLTGLVKTQGAVHATGEHRVSDVLPVELLLDASSRRRIDLIHTDGTRETCDLDLFLRLGDNSLNPRMRDGDILHVPSATEHVWAQGAVAQPGRYELGERDSLLTLLRLAGEPLPAAEVDRVLTISFPDPFAPESLWVDLRDVYSRKVNPALTDGFRLYVYYVPQYQQQEQSSVLGEVRRPGVYPIKEGVTRLSDLMTQAKGFTTTADLSAIRVHRRSGDPNERDPELDRLLRLSRNDLTATEYEVLRTKLAGLREEYRVDWKRLGETPDLDLLLRDGDLVRVERLVSSIRLDGEVRRPGILNFIPGQHVEDYVRAAGGYTDRAWRGKVRVTRAVTGQTLLARNIGALDPGDLVWVPERPDQTIWEQFREVLTAAGAIATVIIAIRSVR